MAREENEKSEGVKIAQTAKMNDLFEKLRRKGYEGRNFYVQRNKLKQRTEIWVIEDPSDPESGRGCGIGGGCK